MSLNLGYFGERNARDVRVPLLSVELWPEATHQLIVTRPDKVVYLVTSNLDRDGDELIWHIKPEDVCASGVGNVVVHYMQVNDVLGKDPVLQTVVTRSTDTGDVQPLDPYEPEILRLQQLAVQAKAASVNVGVYAEKAQDAAAESKDYAEQAKSYIDESKAAAQEASRYAGEAKTYTAEIKDAKESAETSAQNAASSAESANNAVTDVNNSKIAAERYAESAENAAEDAVAAKGVIDNSINQIRAEQQQFRQFLNSEKEDIASSQQASEQAKTDAVNASRDADAAKSAAQDAQRQTAQLLDNATGALAQKQDKLVSGTSIKTVNGESLLGGGDIVIHGEEVTADTIHDALGYTPADDAELNDAKNTLNQLAQDTEKDIDEIKSDYDNQQKQLDGKLTKPETAPTVGKMLKVKSVNKDGTFVCEWADLSIGETLSVDSDGNYNVKSAGPTSIANRMNNNFIQSRYVNNIVKAALTDERRIGTQNDGMTDAEMSLACQTIGAEPAKGDWVLKGTIATENKSSGASLNLAGCTELLVKGWTTGTGSTLFDFYPYASGIVNGVSKSGSLYFKFHVADFDTGFKVVYGRSGNYAGNIPLYLNTELAKYDYQYVKVSNITKFFFEKPDLVSECSVEIYAR